MKKDIMYLALQLVTLSVAGIAIGILLFASLS